MNENDKTEILEPVETPAENITEPSKDGRKCPKWLPPLVAAVCAVILVAAGIIGWNAYSGAKLAEAKEACATAADTVRNNANEYNALLNGDAADAAAVKAEQVKDSKTVESLGKELKAMAPEYEGCVAENAQGLDAAAVKLNEQADWYETHEKSLSKAVRAVVESKAAKRLDDAKTNLTAKLDEASKLLADSDGKVADNATRDALSNAIDAANGDVAQRSQAAGGILEIGENAVEAVGGRRRGDLVETDTRAVELDAADLEALLPVAQAVPKAGDGRVRTGIQRARQKRNAVLVFPGLDRRDVARGILGHMEGRHERVGGICA